MAFDTFTSGRRITKDPSVTIIKQGSFNLNSGSMKLLKQQNTTHVHLMFDPDTRRIAFKPCPKDAPGAYALREDKSPAWPFSSTTTFLTPTPPAPTPPPGKTAC